MIQCRFPHHCSREGLRIWASTRRAWLSFLGVHWQTGVEIRLHFVEVRCLFWPWGGLIGTCLALPSAITSSWNADLLLVTLILVVYYFVELFVAIRGVTGQKYLSSAWLRLLHEVLLAWRRRGEFFHLLTLVWLLSLVVSRSKWTFLRRTLPLFIGRLFLNTLFLSVLLEQLDKLGASSSLVERHSAIWLFRVRTAYHKVLFNDSHVNIVGLIVA